MTQSHPITNGQTRAPDQAIDTQSRAREQAAVSNGAMHASRLEPDHASRITPQDPASRLTHQDDASPLTPQRSLGFSLFMWGNDDAPGRDKYRLMLEGAKYFDRNGFEAVWTPERHFHAFGGPYPNPSVTGAALAAVTERIGIRAGSCVSPLHHPIRIAEEWAIVDNLSNGRVAIAFASGWQLNDFVLRPENYANNRRVLLEQIDQVRRLWRGEKIPFPNPLGQEVAIRTLPRPVQPELPFWVTTAGNPDTYRQAGELGANVLTHLLGQTVDEVAKKIAIYREARAAAGHDPATGRVTLMLHTFVGDDDGEVRELVRQPMKDYLRSSIKLVLDLASAVPAFKSREGAKLREMDVATLSPEEIDTMLDFAFERYFETSGLFGTLGTCARMIERSKRAGVDEIACLLDFGVPTERVMASLPYLNRVREEANTKPASNGSSNTLELNGDRANANGQIYPFLATLRERDIQVWADGDRLRCNAPPGTLTAELRAELQQRKDDILKFLQSASAIARQQRAIVPLQPRGTRTPVFGVAGHNGDVFCYRTFAKHLGEDQPFLGLQPPGLDGESEPLTRVEDLVAYFAEQIRGFQPKGPYVIAGYCSGGTIAFELARRLMLEGATVELLALFGSPFPTWYRFLPQLHLRLYLRTKSVAKHARRIAALPLTSHWSYVTERLRNRNARNAELRSAAADPIVARGNNVRRVTLAAISRYEPKHFAGRMALFLPDQWGVPPQVLLEWRTVAPHTEEYFGPNGCNGDNMLLDPHAPAFAEFFKQCCERSPAVAV